MGAEKYYISDQPYFHGAEIDKVWEFLCSFIANLKGDIVVVDWLMGENEFIIDDEIFSVKHFRYDQPYKIEVSQKPFIVSGHNMYLCFHYKYSDSIMSQFETDWLTELKKTMVTYSFTIKVGKKIVFWVQPFFVGALLSLTELKIFTRMGLNFEEWNVRLNETL